MKKYYEQDNVTIWNGDNCDVLGTFPRECIDLVVTSPPYDDLRTYGGHSWDFYGVAWQLKRVLKPGGVIVWIVNDATKDGSETGTSFQQAMHFKTLGLNLHDTMIYEAAGTGAKGSNLAYWQAFEFMYVFSKGRPDSVNRIADVKNKTIGLLRGGRFRENGQSEKPHFTQQIGVRTNIWRYQTGFMDTSDKTEHPAPFPEALARDHILSWSNEGDTVLDCFNGSGTVTKMARNLGRKAIGIEISEEYCAIAAKRLAQSVLAFD